MKSWRNLAGKENRWSEVSAHTDDLVALMHLKSYLKSWIKVKGSKKGFACSAKWNNQTYFVCLCPRRQREEKFLCEVSLPGLTWWRRSTAWRRISAQPLSCFVAAESDSAGAIRDRMSTFKDSKLFCFLRFLLISVVVNLRWPRLCFQRFSPGWRLTRGPCAPIPHLEYHKGSSSTLLQNQ